MDRCYKLNVNGLDDKMDEGIPDKHIVLIAGTPGTMKSTLAYYTLLSNAQSGDTKALYLTLEQDKDNFMYHLNKMRLGDNAEGRMNLFDLTTTREQWLKWSKNNEGAAKVEEKDEKMSMDTFKRQLETLKGAMGFNLLVIDSLPVVEMMFKMKEPRDELFQFFKWLKTLGVTTLVITEMTQDSPKFSKHDIDFLADGIIKLSMAQISPTKVQRQIQVIKMRGVNHTTDPFELRFSDNRFEALKVII